MGLSTFRRGRIFSRLSNLFEFICCPFHHFYRSFLKLVLNVCWYPLCWHFIYILFDFSLFNCLVSQFEVDVIQDLRLPRESPPRADVESQALEKDMSVPPAPDQEGLLDLSHTLDLSSVSDRFVENYEHDPCIIVVHSAHIRISGQSLNLPKWWVFYACPL